jgi:hypothetical protein
VYRFVPAAVGSLTAGRLQALQVISPTSGEPIVFHPGQADADILGAGMAELHTYGVLFATRWVTLHDTAVDGNAPYNANALAKARLATPFKRPENGLFQPGSGFRRYFFTETGDNNPLSEAGPARGGNGALFEVRQSSPSADGGTLRVFFVGDGERNGFDNLSFAGRDELLVVEDGGDTLHQQLDRLDSGWLLDVRLDYADAQNQPVRFLAQGRDPSATTDAALVGMPGYQNDGDNEVTGIHVSDGDPSRNGILGAKIPRPFHAGWRIFYSQMHGENVQWEIVPRRAD